eukprot:1174404-Prorocentrum_minimum.AAC.2
MRMLGALMWMLGAPMWLLLHGDAPGRTKRSTLSRDLRGVGGGVTGSCRHTGPGGRGHELPL